MSNYWRAPLKVQNRTKALQTVSPEFLAEWRRHNHASRAVSRKEREQAQHQRRLKWADVTRAMQRGEES